MQIVGRLFPPTYIFEGLRAILAGQTPPATMLLWPATLDGLFLILGFWTFARTYRYAVRTGLIARYSAETVS
jgi:ABC-2 type transport system permease protein